MRHACLLLSCLVAAPCVAGERIFWLGVGASELEPESAVFAPLDLEYERGLTAAVGGAADAGDGFWFRGHYAFTRHPELTAVSTLLIDEDIDRHELRAGALYVPVRRGALSAGVGAGLTYVSMRFRGGTEEAVGGFVDAEGAWAAAPWLTLTAGAAWLVQDGDPAAVGSSGSRNTDGHEARLAATVHRGRMDYALAARYARLLDDDDTGSTRTELLVRVGRRWGGATPSVSAPRP